MRAGKESPTLCLVLPMKGTYYKDGLLSLAITVFCLFLWRCERNAERPQESDSSCPVKLKKKKSC